MPGKITELSDAGALTGDEYVEVVDDPTGTPVSRRTTAAEIAALGGVTIGRSSLIGQWTMPGVAISGVANRAINADTIYYARILVAESETYDRIGIDVATAGSAGGLARLGLAACDANWQPTALTLDAGTVAIDSTGHKDITISQTLTAGRYLAMMVASVGFTPRGLIGTVPGGQMIRANTTAPFIMSATASFTFAAFSSPPPNWGTSFDWGNVGHFNHIILRRSA